MTLKVFDWDVRNQIKRKQVANSHELAQLFFSAKQNHQVNRMSRKRSAPKRPTVAAPPRPTVAAPPVPDGVNHGTMVLSCDVVMLS